VLEEEWVEVSSGFRLLWHRPPLEEVERQWQDPETVRIFVNGCFDIMHAGHFNVLRQAKSLFRQKGYRKVILVAGLHSDAAITHQKGPPLFLGDERLAVLRATKWVDEIASELPYVSMSSKMADCLRVHFICHGDDLPICKTGGGMYSEAIESNRFQMLKRTEGISTTQILDRLLSRCGAGAAGARRPDSVLDSMLATTRRLAQFAAPDGPAEALVAEGESRSTGRVVYVGGTFDLLHAGHVQLLEAAALLGDSLLVGLHSDETVCGARGEGPVLTLLERAMAVLSLRSVTDVVLGAPWVVSRELIATLGVSAVAVGRRPDGHERRAGDVDPLALPRSMGILVELEGQCALTSEVLRRRFAERSSQLAERNGELLRKEFAYIDSKAYVPEA